MEPIGEFDISGLEKNDAEEYIARYAEQLVTEKKLLRDLTSQSELWQKRAELAKQNNDAELIAAALERSAGLNEKINDCRSRADYLRRGIKKMKDDLRFCDSRQILFKTDALAQEMNFAAGLDGSGAAAAEKKFKAAEIDEALKNLKEKMNGGEP